MSDPTAVDALIGGILMPLIIALINQWHWSSKLKAIVALLACMVAAAVVQWLRGPLNVHAWRDTLVVITGAALIMYHTWWRPSTIAPALEAATTVTNRLS